MTPEKIEMYSGLVVVAILIIVLFCTAIVWIWLTSSKYIAPKNTPVEDYGETEEESDEEALLDDFGEESSTDDEHQSLVQRLLISADINRKGATVLVVMGDDKSRASFMSSLTQYQVPHSFKIQIATFIFDEQPVFLVSLPSFRPIGRKGEKSGLSDAQTLRDIAGWLCTSYQKKITISGMIYLHSFEAESAGILPLTLNSEIFKKLCGDQNLSIPVALATTEWKIPASENHRLSEMELLDKPEVWKDFLAVGTNRRYFQHTGYRRSALRIIDFLLERRSGGEKVVLRIQREIVDNGLDLDMTEAGSYLQEIMRRPNGIQKMYQYAIREHQKWLESGQLDEVNDKDRPNLKLDYNMAILFLKRLIREEEEKRLDPIKAVNLRTLEDDWKESDKAVRVQSPRM